MNYLSILLWIIAPAVALVLLGGALAFAMSFVESFNRTMREHRESQYPQEIDVEANSERMPEWLKQNGIDPNRIPKDAEISIIQAIEIEEYEVTQIGGKVRPVLTTEGGETVPTIKIKLYPLEKPLTPKRRK